jgi:hypothetical protein
MAQGPQWLFTGSFRASFGKHAVASNVISEVSETYALYTCYLEESVEHTHFPIGVHETDQFEASRSILNTKASYRYL